MLPLLCTILVSTAALSAAQVYLPAPTSHLFYPASQQKTPPQETVSNGQQELREEVLDDPYATMEIYRQQKYSRASPESQNSALLPAEARVNPEVTVESSLGQIQVSSQGQAIVPVDYFALLGGSPPSEAEKNEDYSTLFTTTSPTEISQPETANLQTSGTQVFPAESFGFPGAGFPSGFTANGDPQGKPTRYYPVQSGFSPISDFGSSGNFAKSESVKQLEGSIDEAVLPKSVKPKKKYSSKLKKFPKKYRPTPKKLRNKPKLSPASELLDEFSLESMKNKRKIPFSYGGSGQSFNSDYDSFGDGKDTADFTSGPSSAPSVAPSRRPSSYKAAYSSPSEGSSDSSDYTGGSSAGYTGVSGGSSGGYSGDSGSSGRYIGDSGSSGASPERYSGGSGGSSGRYSGDSGSSGRYTGDSGGSSAAYTGGSGGFGGGSDGGFEGSSAAYTGGSGGGGFVGSTAAFHGPSASSNGERMQFQMFGMDGPHSYKFGYDTGKGHNRHFRFEERDNHGKVKGHYGFYDQEGKMSMIHYEADPHTGYKAGPYHHPENHHDYDYNHQNNDSRK